MFLDNVLSLIKENGISKNKMLTDLKLSTNSFVAWRTRGTIPNGETLKKIADYFNVSIEYLLGQEEKPESNIYITPSQNIFMIPLFESVSAGFGVNANENAIGTIPMYIKSSTEAGEYICITVSGDSMSPKIENGDIIHVRKQTSVDSGQIAVIMLDGEAFLVKKVEYTDDYIDLISLNEDYKPMHFDGKDIQRIKVLGCVKQITKHI